MLDAFPWDVGLSLVVSGSRVTIIIHCLYMTCFKLQQQLILELSFFKIDFQLQKQIPAKKYAVCHIDNLAKRIVLLNVRVGFQYRLWHSHEYRNRVLTDNLKEISPSFRKYYIFLCLNIFQFIHQTSEMTKFDCLDLSSSDYMCP